MPVDEFVSEMRHRFPGLKITPPASTSVTLTTLERMRRDPYVLRALEPINEALAYAWAPYMRAMRDAMIVRPEEPLDPFPTFWPPESTLWTFKHRHELGHTPRNREDRSDAIWGVAVLIFVILVIAALGAAWVN